MNLPIFQSLRSLVSPEPKASSRISRVNLLVQACNLTCPMCSMNLNNTEIGQVLRDYPSASSGPQLRLDEYKAFFESLRAHKPAVSIGGGEPMVFPYMVELIEYLVNDLGFPVGITTNATLFTDEKLERLGQAAPNITISIDGLRARHDEIRGVGNFDISVGNIRKLLELKRAGRARARIASLFCLHDANYEQTADVAKFLFEEVGIEAQTISFLLFSRRETLARHEDWVHHKGLSDNFRIALTKGGVTSFADFSGMDFEGIWNTKQDLQRRYENIRFEPNFRSLEDLRTYFLTDDVMSVYFHRSCNPSRTQFTLISNGDVLFFPQCFQIKLGNIRQQSPEEIWHSDLFRQIRAALARDLSPVCAHCCANRIEKVV